MYLYWIVAFQIAQFGITTALHVVLCVNRYHHQWRKLLAAMTYHLIMAAIVIKFYFVPTYYDFGVTVYKMVVPFTETGIEDIDRANSLALFCLPLIMMTFGLFYFILSKNLGFVRFFYGYAASKTISRAICINTMICAAIDILITRAFIGDDSTVNIIDFSLRLLFAALMWTVVYHPILICLIIRYKKGAKAEGGDKGDGTKQHKGTAPSRDDNPYSYP